MGSTSTADVREPGTTASELVETTERKTGGPYNIFVGHLVGVMSGFMAVHAISVPGLATELSLFPRIGAAVLAAALTVLITLAVKASQPAAVATALIVALALFHWQDGFVIGEPLRVRRMREKSRNQPDLFKHSA